ncbi:NAD dependent epimerase/dehydratase [Mollisia scopiformis]|uniref:NAD dependent epimerase/dehydratase n=1 Tax=Mollisia scopiformis TaxID=149040 RepID=A0A194WTG4_MOLSC|nr:NAD dependent epimerase/dehydratase [Mollisia scopiformis]KUJ10902.1 NAD dependent epimerase/dehydratase [Mollisia scopiformis]
MPFMTQTHASSSLLLITGVTGHIGFRVLVLALTAGHTIRACVRSPEKAKLITSHPLIRSLAPGPRLTFIVVPDLCKKHAYDDACRGVAAVIHIASPLMSNGVPAGVDQEAFFVKPAVRGTLNMLEAARKSGTVRRVVITSSITALIPFEELSGAKRCKRWIGPSDRIPVTKGPWNNEFEAYATSKVAALAEAESWMRRHDEVGFDVVHLHPSFVEGRNELAASPRETLKGTNAIVLGIALGQKFEYSTMGATVHLEDVARVHLQALDTAVVPGNASYILSQDTIWDDVTDITARRFPDEVEKRALPNSGSAVTHTVFVDTSLTEEVFGFEHIGFEEQVESVVGHYLELRAKSGKKISLRRA